MEEQGVDFETSGLKYLTNEARVGPYSLHSNKVTEHSPYTRLRTQAAFLPVGTYICKDYSTHREPTVCGRCNGLYLQNLLELVLLAVDVVPNQGSSQCQHTHCMLSSMQLRAP